jgi:hypothetical protein
VENSDSGLGNSFRPWLRFAYYHRNHNNTKNKQRRHGRGRHAIREVDYSAWVNE